MRCRSRGGVHPGIALALAAALLNAWPESATAQDLIFPEWRYEPAEDASIWRRGAGRTAEISWSFVNDTISDTWSITRSPVGWSLRDWLLVGAIAGATTGMMYSVDSQVRQAAVTSPGFRDFGEGIRPLGNGAGLAATAGGALLIGVVFDREKERETARLLLEASAIGLGFTSLGKVTFGRERPRDNQGPLAFHPFSGAASMPSGETTSAFIIAGVLSSQYPEWYWQLLAYSAAAAVGAGRIALDAHWTSDVFLSAALGIAISKTVVHLNRKRKARRLRERRTGAARRDTSHHYFFVTPRSFRWTYVW